MKLFRDTGIIARAALGAALLALGAVTARAQNYPVYDIVVPVGPTSALTVIDGTSRILPTNRSFVIGLAGGTRGCIEIRNFTATPEYPLIIVNQHGTGKVVITDVGGSTRREGITIVNCQHFQLRGDNDPAYRYGIEVAQVGSKAGLAREGVYVRGTSSDGEIAFLEVHDSGFSGIMVKSNVDCNVPEIWAANFVMRNINVHDNYVHHTGGEGMYLGSTHWFDVASCGAQVHEIHGLRVSYNLVEHTGYESIQVASNPVDTKVFDNVLLGAGENPNGEQGSNFQIGGGGSGEYFNNVMIGARYNNINCTGQESAVSIYNNLLVDAGHYGIFAKNLPDNPVPTDPDVRQTIPGSFVHIFNNTIVNPARTAFSTLDEISVNRFRNNLCVIPNTAFASPFVLDGGATVTESNNLFVRNTSTVAFVNESERDYRIASGSAAINQGTSLASLPSGQVSVTTDFQGNARPFGSAYDIGWNEFGALSVYLIATPPTTVGGTGSVKASVIGGTAPYTYAWSTGATTQTISGVTQGQYTVTVTDAVGAKMTKATYLIDKATMGAPVRVVPPTEVLAPTFSLAPGAYSGPQLVTLSTGTSGASIRYTLDGSVPTATTGTVYSGAISVPNTRVLKAVAYKSGMATSQLSTATYYIDNGPTNSKFTPTVTASSYTGSNIPANTLDGNLSTTWTVNNAVQWIQYDFGSSKRLGYFALATYMGDARVYTLDVLVSTDGTNWTTLFANMKTPKQLGLQVYDIPDIDPVRYVRFVGYGSTYSASISAYTEVEFWGGNPGTAVAPSFTLQPSSQTVSTGANVTFNATATGAPTPTYQWFKNGAAIVGATSSSLSLSNVQTSHAGTYTVVASNGVASTTSNAATLTVNGSGGSSLGVDLQAESAVLFGAVARTNQTGYTGTGFVDYINASGDYIEWTATMPSAGSRTLTFRYASTGSPRLLEIKVNGTVVNTGLAFPNTGGANIWTTLSTTATLPAGTVTIRATATGTSGPNMDYLRID